MVFPHKNKNEVNKRGNNNNNSDDVNIINDITDSIENIPSDIFRTSNDSLELEKDKNELEKNEDKIKEINFNEDKIKEINFNEDEIKERDFNKDEIKEINFNKGNDAKDSKLDFCNNEDKNLNTQYAGELEISKSEAIKLITQTFNYINNNEIPLLTKIILEYYTMLYKNEDRNNISREDIFLKSKILKIIKNVDNFILQNGEFNALQTDMKFNRNKYKRRGSVKKINISDKDLFHNNDCMCDDEEWCGCNGENGDENIKIKRSIDFNIKTEAVTTISENIELNINKNITEEIYDRIYSSLKSTILFFMLNVPEQRLLIYSMRRIEYEEDIEIFKINEEGTKFYFIDEGIVDVIRNNDKNTYDIDDRVPNPQIEELKDNDTFGVLALIHSNNKRTATVRTKTKCVLWYIEQYLFNFIASIRKIEKRKFLNTNIKKIIKLKDRIQEENNVQEEQQKRNIRRSTVDYNEYKKPASPPFYISSSENSYLVPLSQYNEQKERNKVISQLEKRIMNEKQTYIPPNEIYKPNKIFYTLNAAVIKTKDGIRKIDAGEILEEEFFTLSELEGLDIK
ncbi:cAMP-dependent protein kinase regulatory subunit [Spraguea lophii 42_110]|uniref:cAMP-dependent protein kinase regulatory subunit n=1 Tax=Spraguea lophii (strain 42_110) TaxID=1358809 RepID=S7XI79_SPRLO|nr:cAMP-dependent protein kinase regulatory subunit [Spraguea lophii 42_110]